MFSIPYRFLLLKKIINKNREICKGRMQILYAFEASIILLRGQCIPAILKFRYLWSEQFDIVEIQ